MSQVATRRDLEDVGGEVSCVHIRGVSCRIWLAATRHFSLYSIVKPKDYVCPLAADARQGNGLRQEVCAIRLRMRQRRGKRYKALSLAGLASWISDVCERVTPAKSSGLR